MPESPRWLLSRGRTEEGINLLKKIAKFNKNEIPEEVLEKLRTGPAEEECKNEQNENFLDLIKSRVLVVRLLIAAIGW